MQEISVAPGGSHMVVKRHAAKVAPKAPLRVPYVVEWWTAEGVYLASHPMTEADAEAMVDLLDANAEIVPV